MYYVCIEDNEVTSIIDYEPSVPDTVSIETITDAKFKSIQMVKVTMMQLKEKWLK